MCTLAVSFGVFTRYPFVVAANRDEFYARPSEPPQVLSTGPAIFGPRDMRAGGTWTGVNEHGLFAGLTNISGVVPFDPARRSRGQLVIEALRQRSAAAASTTLAGAAGRGAFNPFQAVLCDGAELHVVKYLDAPEVTAHGPGIHVFSNWDELAEVAARKGALVRGRIETVDRDAHIETIVPVLIGLLSDHSGDEWHHRLCVHTDGYGTMSSMIYAVDRERKTAAYFAADGHPCEAAFRDLSNDMREGLGW